MLLNQKVIDIIEWCYEITRKYDGPTLSIDIFYHDEKKRNYHNRNSKRYKK